MIPHVIFWPSVPAAIRCPALPPIYNVQSGNITIRSNTDHFFKGSTLHITGGRYLEIVSFHCKSEPFPEDYNPRTGLSVECGGNGTWSSQNVSCIGGKDVYPPPPPPPHPPPPTPPPAHTHTHTYYGSPPKSILHVHVHSRAQRMDARKEQHHLNHSMSFTKINIPSTIY